jgi:long-chain-fatty-acid--CoA ligase ACSBG
MMFKTVNKYKDKTSLFVERNGKILTWTWLEYWNDCLTFAKALGKIGVPERSAVAIMGFNAPEWVQACVGAIMYNCLATGIYITNSPEACLY